MRLGKYQATCYVGLSASGHLNFNFMSNTTTNPLTETNLSIELANAQSFLEALGKTGLLLHYLPRDYQDEGHKVAIQLDALYHELHEARKTALNADK